MRTRSAFTLVELLVVLAIIAVLMTIGLVIGARARAGAKESVTLETIKTLETALNDYVSQKGEMPKPYVKLEGATGNVYQVIADASDSATDASESHMIKSGGYLMYQLSKVQSSKAILDEINPKFLDIEANAEAPGFREPLDGFGREIRYVHPAFQGIYATGRDQASTFGVLPGGGTFRPTQIFRTVTNSDGGQCVSNKPYFYSCGVDGKPETHDDNLYPDNSKPNFVQ
jgi:hypothetical protein